MQLKLALCMALACLAVLPALNARAIEGGERELMELAIQALESGQAMSAEESMAMQSGTYGAGNMVGAYGGSAGGILDSDASNNSGLEAGESNKPATAAAPAPAPAKAKSAALSAHQSAGLMAAGLVAAVFLL